MTDWTDVPRIVDGVTTFSAASLNPIVDALTNRTSNLNTRLNNLSGSCGLAYTDSGFDTVNYTIGKGTILAFVDGLYVPAKATWSSEIRSDGSVAPSPKANIVGVLITDISDGYGTILSYGWSTDPTLITAILGNEPTSGQYFLNANGYLTNDVTESLDVPIYVLTYKAQEGTAGKLIFNPKTPEYSGHSHAAVDLPFSGWAVTSTSSTFTAASGSELEKLLLGGLNNGYLSQNGIGVDPSLWSISGTSIITDFQVFSGDKMILYAIAPMQGKDPLVHSVSVDSTNSLLKAENYNGNVVLSLDTDPVTTTAYTGTAVLDISGGTVTKGPVVQQLVAGPGVTLTSGEDLGLVTIGVSTYDQRQIDMIVTNLDGALLGTDPNLPVVYKFPAGVTSRIQGSFRVPHISGGTYSAVLNLVFYGSGFAVPEISAQLQVFPLPVGDTPASPGLSNIFTSSAIATTTSGLLYKAAIDLSSIAPLASDAIVCCSLYPSATPSNTITLLSASLQLVPVVD